MRAKLPCTIDDLIPASDLIPYFPVVGDRFKKGKFWDSAKWPRITEFYRDHAGRNDIFTALSEKATPINPDLARGAWSFSTDSLAYEIRCYLWHYFRAVETRFSEIVPKTQLLERLTRWSWREQLRHLVSRTSFTVVTFNYDRFLPFSLPISPLHSCICPVESHIPPENYPVGAIPIYSVHGSISNRLNLPFLPGGNRANANPWLVASRSEANLVSGYVTESVGNLDQIPMVPDIVPPGFKGDDICNPASRVSQFAKHSVTNADILVVCGLSGHEPDTDEVTQLFGSISEECNIVSVGLSTEMESNPVNNVLSRVRSASFEYVPASDVDGICESLESSCLALREFAS